MCFQMNYWLLQNEFYDPAYKKLVDSLNYIAELHPLVKILFINFKPFSVEFDIPADIQPYDKVMVYSTQSLIDFMIATGKTPVAYTNENFNVDVWKKLLDDKFLNYDTITKSLETLEPALDEFFIRPIYDNKVISGTIMNKSEFNNWKSAILKLSDSYTTIDKNTLLTYSTIKNIKNEYRFFVIDNTIVTASQYANNKKLCYSDNIPMNVYEFVADINDIFTPDTSFCIDIAELDTGELKVIEYNCINTCGLYAADVYKYALALTNQLLKS